MGVVETIDIERFPVQGPRLHCRTRVCFKYDPTREIGATVVRDDREPPHRTILRLDDGRHVLSTECQYTLPELPATLERIAVHGVCWLLIREGCVLLEQCAKKAAVLGVGEWFVPGGKIEPTDKSEGHALMREINEEWPTVALVSYRPLPIVEGSAVPPGPRGLFLMRPYVVTVASDYPHDIPQTSADRVPLRWFSIEEALRSPVPQVRMMVAAAMGLK